MVTNYEVYMILNPELSSAQVSEQIKSVKHVLETEVKASNINVTEEGLRKLAYAIEGHPSGFYALITFDIEGDSMKNMHNVERKLNLNEQVLRYIIVNQTDFLKQKAKENLNKEPEFNSHRELNKGLGPKKSYPDYIGLKAIDYKDVAFLSQFTSPYSKIFARAKTGTSSKMQRKLNTAIKRARHMALMSFTPQKS